MGRAYSINGYLNAIMRRSGNRTLMVEGATDKNAIHRIIATRPVAGREHVTIDTPEIVTDVRLAGMGAKAKIMHIADAAQQVGSFSERIARLLGYLVDREWDDLFLDEQPVNWSPPNQRAPMFVTMGHSIENYYFDARCFSEYLRHSFPKYFTRQIESEIPRLFPNAVALAGAYSFAAREASLVKRLSGLISFEHVEVSRGVPSVLLGLDFVNALTSRNVPDPNYFIESVNDSVINSWLPRATQNHTRWLLHGHLGSEMLWATVGAIAVQVGVPAAVAQSITHGFQEERQRVCWSWLLAESCERVPLDEVVDWLLEADGVHANANETETV